MMNGPIPISKNAGDDTPPEAILAFQKAKHEHRIQMVFLAMVGVVGLAFLIPLSAWLTRLALGG